MENSWFAQWFDSPYYHLLYSNRDEQEASLFIERLAQTLHFSPDKPILDLACGKGRYAIQLHKRGFCVEGIDLAANSIAEANVYADDTLQFAVHDMRYPYKKDYFAVVLNLFTSFGYFDDDTDNQKAMNAFTQNLRPHTGVLVIDFMNTPKVIATLVASEIKVVDAITFNITRRVASGFILKDIDFEADGVPYHYQEKVKIITIEDFMRYFETAGLRLKMMFGNYALSNYEQSISDRMIFVLERI